MWYISAPLNLSFGELKTCSKAASFAYKKHLFEDKNVDCKKEPYKLRSFGLDEDLFNMQNTGN